MTQNRAVSRYLAAAAIGLLLAGPAAARDAAFMDPGTLGGGDEAVKVEPKGEIDIGDTAVGTARRTTVFFVNESGAPVKVEKVEANSDANVSAQISSDDCTKQGVILPQSRCSVEVSITPTGAGSWTAEILMTHNGAGRLARAKISGKTTGVATDNDKKETGLAVTSKESNPVDFGQVPVDSKAVRSALMVNDSPDSITLYSIDVIEASNGLQLLDQGGCTVDMELKPGESCPVTLVWSPTEGGQISTDLIIRHSGRLGFAVIPIRGTVTGVQKVVGAGESDKNPKSTSLIPPPTADELDKAAAGKIPLVSAAALPAAAVPAPSGPVRLIGTVGGRAVLQVPDGKTQIFSAGDEVPMGDNKSAKLIEVDAKSIKITIDGKTRELTLEASPELVARAADAEAQAAKDSDSNSKDKKSSKSGASVNGSGSSRASLSNLPPIAPSPSAPAYAGGPTPANAMGASR